MHDQKNKISSVAQVASWEEIKGEEGSPRNWGATCAEALDDEQRGQGTSLNREVTWTALRKEARAAKGITLRSVSFFFSSIVR